MHPGAGTPGGTLVNALLRHVRDLSGVGGVLRPGIVHRLDKGTSGLLVVAKDDETHRALVRQFAGRTVEKEYLALVLGVPARRSGEVDAPIGRDPVHRQRMSVRAPRGREARSSWRVEERFDGAALLRVRIHTGRTHQIRVHLASIGHPVAGDATYGGTRTPSSRRAAAREALLSLERPALHAARLAFTHPASGERLAFEAPASRRTSLAVLERLRGASHALTAARCYHRGRHERRSSAPPSAARVLQHRRVHAGKVLDLDVDEVVEPGGVRGLREVVRQRGSVAALPVLADGRVVLVRQYRYAVDAFVWELPAGRRDPGETPEEGARRELEEEVGLRAARPRAAPRLLDDTRLLRRGDAPLPRDRPRARPAAPGGGREDRAGDLHAGGGARDGEARGDPRGEDAGRAAAGARAEAEGLDALPDLEGAR